MENQSLDKVPNESAFSMQSFDHAQRVAKMLASSSLIPKEFQNNIQNTMIALEMANRIGASPLMVMQNLYIVHGRPSWSSTFIIAALNSCNKFSPLRFEVTGEGDATECYAWAYELGTKEKLVGPVVSMKMAKAEGWIDKNGSKWKTMPALMIRYRSAAFFGRLYAPEILMGMLTNDEVVDITHVVDDRDVRENKVDKEAERVALLIEDAKSSEQLEQLEPHVRPEQMDLFQQKRAALNGIVQ